MRGGAQMEKDLIPIWEKAVFTAEEEFGLRRADNAKEANSGNRPN